MSPSAVQDAAQNDAARAPRTPRATKHLKCLPPVRNAIRIPTLLLAAFAICATPAARVLAEEPQCAPPIDIAAGNRAAEAFFRQRVVKPSAVGSPARSRPAGFVDAAAFGALGDGISDDTAALQRAFNEARKVWLGTRLVYRVTRRLLLPSNAGLASDGTATMLVAAGRAGFDNAIASRSDDAIYGERGAALRAEGDGIAIRDLFIVKEFEDDRYVIGIDVRASTRVRIQRVRLRGFSLAPGIITIRSSDQVEVSSTLIHDACTASTKVPGDVPSFQVTGISIDDTRVDRRGSTRIVLQNNVIADLRMIPRTPRGTQTDGINFAAIGTGSGSLVRDNHVSDVDEALDIFGSGIEASGNRLQATGTVVKLIHGARSVRIRGNQITGAGGALAVGLFRASPAEEARQVRDVVIEGNRFRVAEGRRPAIEVDAGGTFPPIGVVIRKNRFDVAECNQRVLACLPDQCTVSSNRRLRTADNIECPD